MRTTKFFLLAATAMTFAACSNDNEPTVENSPVAAQVYAGINAVQSRAAGTSWDANDEIGISCKSAGTTYNNVQYVTTAGDGSFTHVNGSANGIFFENTDVVTFTAYYPFYGTNAYLPGEDGIITDVTTEEQANQKKFDFLFATATASRTNPTLSFTGDNAFKHKMTRLIINVKADANSGFDAEHVFIGQYSIGGIKHSGTFNTATGEAVATGDATSEWKITGAADDKETNVRTYDMILYPQSEASLTFKVNIAGQEYVAPAITPALAAGTSYTYTITVKKTGLEVSSCTIDKWGDGGSYDVDATMPI